MLEALLELIKELAFWASCMAGFGMIAIGCFAWSERNRSHGN